MTGLMTTSSVLLLLVQVGMCMVLAWSVICRATRMNEYTLREVRWAMAFEGIAAGLLGGSWLLPSAMPYETELVANYFGTSWPIGHTPDAVWLLFLLSMLNVQLVTVKHWHDGVPQSFQAPGSPSWTGPMQLRGMALALITALACFSLIAPRAALAQRLQVQLSEPQPVVVLAPGEIVRCVYPGGCVSLVMPVYELMEKAALAGAACQQQGKTL